MEITYTIVVALITVILGAITKAWIDKVPNRFIPLQNVVIGVISGIVCYFIGVEPNIIKALFLCLIGSLAAGGGYDAAMTRIKEQDKINKQKERK